MKKRIRALKAIILVVLMVVELFGVDAIRALADQYLNQDYTITADTAEVYGTNGYSLTIADGVTASGAIYVSGGALVNYGTATATVQVYNGGKVTNSGTIANVEATSADVTITQNSGHIGTLTSENNGNVVLAGGTVTTMTGNMNVETTGTATVNTMSGEIGLSGTGTLKVMDVLNLTNGYAGEKPIFVNESTRITAPAEKTILVTCDGRTTFQLQNISGKTLVEAMGNTILAELQSPETMVAETDFPSEKQLRSSTPVTAVYMAQDGYYFPDNYGASVSDAEVVTTVTEVSENHQKITVNLTFVKDGQTIRVILPTATAKGEQAAPTGLIGGVGQVSGVTTEMEYAESADAAESAWTPVTGIADGDTITLAKGTWYFRYRETDDKKAGASASVVVKGKGEATVEIADVYYGGMPNPKATTTTNTGTQAVIEYKEVSADDSAYSATVPTAIGTYTVRATFAETDDYGEASATADFTIQYLEAPSPAYTLAGTAGENGYYISEVTVTPADGYQISRTLDGTYADSLLVKEDADESVIYLKNKTTGEKTGAVALEAIRIDTSDPILNVVNGETYRAKSKVLEVIDSNLASVTVNGSGQTVSGQSFTTELAEAVEAYVIVAKDKAGRSTTATIYVKRDTQAAPTGLDGGVEEVAGVTSDMEYAASETATAWTAVTGISAEGTMKLAKGTWYFRYRETDTKQAGAATAVIVKEAEKEPEEEPEIIRAEGSGTIRVKDVYYGKLPSVQLSSETNDVTQAEILYKEKGKTDTTYTKEVPANVGSYTVKVTLPQNDAYKALVMTADFNITYLTSPNQPYTLIGTKGENGYYTSEVIVKPAAGYTLATALGGAYADSLRIQKTQTATTIYLKNAAGEMTDAIPLEAVRIKQEAPRLNLEDGKTYYGETQRLEIRDAYLNRVYVNGVLQTLTGPEFVLELSSNHGKKRYEITAVDDAGNKKTIVVDVAAPWMKTGVVPDGVLVNLESGNGYKLGSGNWKVEGDETSYSGNTAFYVKKDGSYTFKSQ